MESEKRNMNLYNNLVVDAGSNINSYLDGYSQRPFSTDSGGLKNKLRNSPDSNFRKSADEFAKTMGKELIFMDWEISSNGAVFYPIVSPVSQFYLMFYRLRKSKLSWIKLNREGTIAVFVSKGDYDRILEEVTYHTLCQNIAEKFEKSFIEFAKGNKENSIKILRGDENE